MTRHFGCDGGDFEMSSPEERKPSSCFSPVGIFVGEFFFGNFPPN